MSTLFSISLSFFLVSMEIYIYINVDKVDRFKMYTLPIIHIV